MSAREQVTSQLCVFCSRFCPRADLRASTSCSCADSRVPTAIGATRGQQRIVASRSRQGISLIETAALIALTGVLVAGFVPTFVRNLRMSKIAEAVERLDSLHRSTAAYYGKPYGTGQEKARECLPESIGPTPEHPSPDPQELDFDGNEISGASSWRALGQTGVQRLRYSYHVLVAQPGCGPRVETAAPAVIFRAHGDLDGDGVLSTLERQAVLSADRSTLEAKGPLRIRQRVE